MTGLLSWSNVESEFNHQFDSFKKAKLDAEQMLKNFDRFLSENNDLDHSIQDNLKKLITSSGLPDELIVALVNRLEEQSTRIISKYASEKMLAKNGITTNTDSNNNSASLLNKLLKWDETKPTKKIESGQIIRDTYCLESKIGQGGMGEVWKAVDLIQDAGDSKDKYVAIKFINHEIRGHAYSLKALVREFSRYKKLIHPNIVKAYELNRDDNEVFIVMEYLEGDVLNDIIKKHPQGIPLNQARPIIKGMCDALEYAHNEGIVHLDFKPGNAFFNSDTLICKVIDFGIARLTDTVDRDKTRFDPGLLGAITTTYASREMLIEAEPDIRDDIYGLACVVYELLSGKHPFDKKLSLKAESEKLRPDPIPGLDDNEFQALLNGLEFERENRTASVKQFYLELFSPQEVASQKRNNWLIKGVIFATLLGLIPFGFYKGYSTWSTNRLISAIEEQETTALNDFRQLSIEKQALLLNSTEKRLAIVKLINEQAITGQDTVQQIVQFDSSIQKALFSDRQIRDYLISEYGGMIADAINQDDFLWADQLSLNILQQYPDSIFLVEKSENINAKKLIRLAELEKEYQLCLADQSKDLIELFPCLQQTANSIRKIDQSPESLATSRLSSRYNRETLSAISQHKLHVAETLLDNWRVLEQGEVKQRTRLATTLSHVNKVEDFIGKISNQTDQQIPDILLLLRKQETGLIKDVINNRIVYKKLLGFYQVSVDDSLASNDFKISEQQIADMKMLFSDLSEAQYEVRKLTDKVKSAKLNYFNDLKAMYKQQLEQGEPDVTAIENIRRKISAIEPENILVKLPDLFESYVQKIDDAIIADQFDLAQRLLNNLQHLKPDNSLAIDIKGLSDKKTEFLNAFHDREKVTQELKKTIENKDLNQVAALVNQIKKRFINIVDQNKVILPNQKQLLEIYQQQIDSSIQQDKYELATKTLDQMITVLPDNGQVQENKNKIASAKTMRLNELIEQSRIAVNSKSSEDYISIFAPLQALDVIDHNYLNNNKGIFLEIQQKLVKLTDQENSFSGLQSIVNQWSSFISSSKSISDENKEFYRKTKNLIALRCLFNGRKLKISNHSVKASEFFIFGLSLEPVDSVKKALEKELI